MSVYYTQKKGRVLNPVTHYNRYVDQYNEKIHKYWNAILKSEETYINYVHYYKKYVEQ